MRVLMAALGSLGDLFPVIGFARALREKGHSVAVITSGTFQREVLDAGLEYIELLDAASYEACRDAFEQTASSRRKVDPEVESLALSVPGRLYRLIEEYHVPGTTVSAALPWFTLGATRLAQEKLGIPNAYVWVNVRDFRLVEPRFPHMLRGLEDLLKNALINCLARPVRRTFDELRRELELPRERNFFRAWWCSAQLNVALFPAWFVPWLRQRLPNTVLTDFPLYQRDENTAVPEQLEKFLIAGDPPVLFTTASWRSKLDDFFTTSVAACEALGVRGVLLSEGIAQTPRSSRSTIAAGYVPLKSLLPRASAIVHHGGLGTIASALAAGTPQLAVPWTGDHPFNARCLERLKVGISLPPRSYGREAASALKRLLADDEIRENCRTIAARFEGRPDFSEAIRRLEELLQWPHAQPAPSLSIP